MPQPKRLTKPYTPADMKLMRQCARQKMSAREAAKVLGRTRGAVAYAAMVRGISFQAITQPKGVQKRRFRKSARKAAWRHKSHFATCPNADQHRRSR